MEQKSYPQGPDEWRRVIQSGLGLHETEARDAYDAGKFPFEQLDQWLRFAFGQGYSSEFLPALQRNIKALVAWAYGDEDEPYWPGSDHDRKPKHG